MELYFYVLTRRVQIHRTFYAKGVLYGQGVPIENIVIHYGPEFSDYTSFDEMKAAFLDTYPDAKFPWYPTNHHFGCIWGSLTCIKRFLLSKHPYCYFVQDDFVPVDSVAEILSDFDKLRAHDPNFRVFVRVHGCVRPVPDGFTQISADVPIFRGLFSYGDQGLILDKEGAAYMVENIKGIMSDPESVLKRSVGTPDGDSFYVHREIDYDKNFMPVKWSEMYP